MARADGKAPLLNGQPQVAIPMNYAPAHGGMAPGAGAAGPVDPSIQMIHQAADAVKTFAARPEVQQAKTQVIASLHAGFQTLKEYHKRGHWTTQTLCFATSCATLIISILSLFSISSILTSPVMYLINCYITVFCIFFCAFEFPKQNEYVKKLRLWVEHWLKIFDRMVGRGFLYIFIGSLVVSLYGLIGFLVGGCMIACGCLSIGVGISIGQKIAHLREQLRKEIGDDFPKLEAAFKRFDVDNDNRISHEEFNAMCASLGIPLSQQELAEALHILDVNSSGTVEFEEFAAWFSSRDKLYA